MSILIISREFCSDSNMMKKLASIFLKMEEEPNSHTKTNRAYRVEMGSPYNLVFSGDDLVEIDFRTNKFEAIPSGATQCLPVIVAINGIPYLDENGINREYECRDEDLKPCDKQISKG